MHILNTSDKVAVSVRMRGNPVPVTVQPGGKIPMHEGLKGEATAICNQYPHLELVLGKVEEKEPSDTPEDAPKAPPVVEKKVKKKFGR